MAELASGAMDPLRASAAANYRQADAGRKGAEHKLVELATGITAWMRAEAHDAGLASGRTNGTGSADHQTHEMGTTEPNGTGPRSRPDGSQGLPEAGSESVEE